MNNKIKEYEVTYEAKTYNKIRLASFSLNILLKELDTVMLTSVQDACYFDKIQGKYEALFKDLGLKAPSLEDVKSNTNIDEDNYTFTRK